MRTWIATALILFTAACAGKTSTGTGEPQTAPLPDRQLGLSKTSVFDAAAPDPVTDVAAEPGEQPTIAPAFSGSPPVVSHGVADFVPITADFNACVDCHLTEEKIEGEPTPIPGSHFMDLRNSPDEQDDEIVGARYDCMTCHAMRTDAPPLVDNRF